MNFLTLPLFLAPLFQAGQPGWPTDLEILEFDGRRVVSLESAPADGSEGTIEFWIRPLFTGGPEQVQCVLAEADANELRIALYLTASGRRLGLKNGETGQLETVACNLADGWPHHVAVATRDQVSRVYVDGQFAGPIYVGYQDGRGLPLLLGSDGEGNHLVGELGGLRLWSRALDREEIRDHMHLSGATLRRQPHPSSWALQGYLAGSPDAPQFALVSGLTGNWLEKSRQKPRFLALDGSELSDFERLNHGSYIAPSIYTVVTTSDPDSFLVYRNDEYYGDFEREGLVVTFRHANKQSVAFFVLGKGGLISAPLMAPLFENRRGSIVELVRPGGRSEAFRERGRIDLTEGSSDRFSEMFPANYRCYNIRDMDPFDYVDTGSDYFVFQLPDMNFAVTAGGVLAPPDLHVIDRRISGAGSTSVLCSSSREIAEAMSIRMGLSMDVNVLGFGGGASVNAKINSKGRSLESSESKQVFAWATTMQYAMVAKRTEMVLDPDFRARIEGSLKAERNYREFLEEVGTHYPYAVTYGGMMGFESTLSKELIETATENDWDIETEVRGKSRSTEFTASAGFGMSSNEELQEMLEEEEKRFWLVGGEGTLASAEELELVELSGKFAPIYLDLRPIFEVLSPQYFDDPEIYTTMRSELEAALMEFMYPEFEGWQNYIPDPVTVTLDFGGLTDWYGVLEVEVRNVPGREDPVRYVLEYPGHDNRFSGIVVDWSKFKKTLPISRSALEAGRSSLELHVARVEMDRDKTPPKRTVVETLVATIELAPGESVSTVLWDEGKTLAKSHLRTAENFTPEEWANPTKAQIWVDTSTEDTGEAGGYLSKLRNAIPLQPRPGTKLAPRQQVKPALQELDARSVAISPRVEQAPPGTIRYWPLDENLEELSGAGSEPLAARGRYLFSDEALAMDADSQLMVPMLDTDSSFLFQLDFKLSSAHDGEAVSISPQALSIVKRGETLMLLREGHAPYSLWPRTSTDEWHRLLLEHDHRFELSRLFLDGVQVWEGRNPELQGEPVCTVRGGPIVQVDELLVMAGQARKDLLSALAARPREVDGEAPRRPRRSHPRVAGLWFTPDGGDPRDMVVLSRSGDAISGVYTWDSSELRGEVLGTDALRLIDASGSAAGESLWQAEPGRTGFVEASASGGPARSWLPFDLSGSWRDADADLDFELAQTGRDFVARVESSQGSLAAFEGFVTQPYEIRLTRMGKDVLGVVSEDLASIHFDDGAIWSRGSGDAGWPEPRTLTGAWSAGHSDLLIILQEGRNRFRGTWLPAPDAEGRPFEGRLIGGRFEFELEDGSQLGDLMTRGLHAGKRIGFVRGSTELGSDRMHLDGLGSWSRYSLAGTWLDTKTGEPLELEPRRNRVIVRYTDDSVHVGEWTTAGLTLSGQDGELEATLAPSGNELVVDGHRTWVRGTQVDPRLATASRFPSAPYPSPTGLWWSDEGRLLQISMNEAGTELWIDSGADRSIGEIVDGRATLRKEGRRSHADLSSPFRHIAWSDGRSWLRVDLSGKWLVESTEIELRQYDRTLVVAAEDDQAQAELRRSPAGDRLEFALPQYGHAIVTDEGWRIEWDDGAMWERVY